MSIDDDDKEPESSGPFSRRREDIKQVLPDEDERDALVDALFEGITLKDDAAPVPISVAPPTVARPARSPLSILEPAPLPLREAVVPVVPRGDTEGVDVDDEAPASNDPEAPRLTLAEQSSSSIEVPPLFPAAIEGDFEGVRETLAPELPTLPPAAPDVDAMLDEVFAMDATVDSVRALPRIPSVLPPPPSHAPVPSRPPPLEAIAFERDASNDFAQTQRYQAWLSRAEWLCEEAQALHDRGTRASVLLQASELLAMIGEDARALALAQEARNLEPTHPLVQRQLRGLLIRQGLHKEALETLDEEARGGQAREVRSHGALFGARIARKIFLDDAGYRERMQNAAHVDPGDVRPRIEEIVEALRPAADGSEPDIGRSDLQRDAHHPALGAACAELAAYRGGAVGTSSLGFYGWVVNARQAASRGDVTTMLTSLDGLVEEAPELRSAVAWLMAAVAWASPSGRSRAHELAKGIAQSDPTPASRWLVAWTAFEVEDWASALDAVRPMGRPVDELFLISLAGRPDEVVPLAEHTAHDPIPTALAGSVSLAVGGLTGGWPGGIPTASRGLIGAAGAALRGLSGAGITHDELREIPNFLEACRLDEAIGTGQIEVLADGLAGINTRDGLLARGLIYETLGQSAMATSCYGALLTVEAPSEGLFRLQLTEHSSEDALLWAKQGGTALLSWNAALWLSHRQRYSEVLEWSAGHAHPLFSAVRAYAAGQLGDAENTTRALGQLAELVDDGLLKAVIGVGEARSSGTDGGALERALASRPDDRSLRLWTERGAPLPTADRAGWLIAQSMQYAGAEAAALALEAALEFEQSGDVERAFRASKRAITEGDSVLAPLCAFRAALRGAGTAEVVETLMAQARAAEGQPGVVEIYRKLAELDERGRGDHASSLLWYRTILEAVPGDLETLRRISVSLMVQGRIDELDDVLLQLGTRLASSEGLAHAALAARLRWKTQDWNHARPAVEACVRSEAPPTWALREWAGYAAAEGDHAAVAAIFGELFSRASSPSDQCACAMRVADALERASLWDEATTWLGRARSVAPDAVVPTLCLAELLEQLGDALGAAEMYSAARLQASSADARVWVAEKATLLFADAGLKDREAAELEAILADNPHHSDAFERLRQIWVELSEQAKLGELLDRRLAQESDPAKRVALEVLRGDTFAQMGQWAMARSAFETALDAHPEDVAALERYAETCEAMGDHLAAAEAVVRRLRLAPDPESQIRLYGRLVELYATLGVWDRAEEAIREILRRDHESLAWRCRLVGLCEAQNRWDDALKVQKQILTMPLSEEEATVQTVAYARLLEHAGHPKDAESTLVQARKRWPKSHEVLEALAQTYDRLGQTAAAHVLLDRAMGDVRRGLNTGRLEPYLFSTAVVVARLRDNEALAEVYAGTERALAGVPSAVTGFGSAAAASVLDELLAPEVITPAFRELLQKTGQLLDSAASYDLAAIRATPLPVGKNALGEEVQSLAKAHGLGTVDVYTSTAIGSQCVAAAAYPPTLVVGDLVAKTEREDVRSFLLHRALLVLKVRASALTRVAPVDLWPILAAYLKVFRPDFAPEQVDVAKMNHYHQKLLRSTTLEGDPHFGLLASEVIGSIGTRGSTLSVAVQGWGSRIGLLAVGDPWVALEGMGWAYGGKAGIPAEGKERLSWIARHAEARELMVFTVSEAYAKARKTLG